MKILHIVSDINTGGASKAAARLHDQILNSGHESIVFSLNNSKVHKNTFSPSRLRKYLARFFPYIDAMFYKVFFLNPSSLFSSSLIGAINLKKVINDHTPDILHLHWVGEGLININYLKKIDIPIVASLHDMWFFTGGCHYDEFCNQFINGCEKCKVLRSSTIDISSFNFKVKESTYKNAKNKITLVGLSRWISRLAAKSKLSKHYNVVHIPNLIDNTQWEVKDKTFAKNIFKLDHSKKTILFGAMNASSDKRKGFDHIYNAIQKFKDENIQFVVVGGGQSNHSFSKLKINCINIPSLSDDISMNLLYSAADVFVLPSIQENLSNMALESLSSGTPVVAFDIGGNQDMIDHKVNGYLASPYDSTDLLNGIIYLLEQDQAIISKNCIEKISNFFSPSVVLKKYLDLYSNLLNDNS